MGITRKETERFIAVIQFISAGVFAISSVALIGKFIASGAINDAIRVFTVLPLILVNLFGGWALLDRMKLGYWLSFINFVPQILSLNLPGLGVIYFYRNLFHGYVGQEFTSGGVANLTMGASLDFPSFEFTLAKKIADQNWLVSIDVLALVICIYLFPVLFQSRRGDA